MERVPHSGQQHYVPRQKENIKATKTNPPHFFFFSDCTTCAFVGVDLTLRKRSITCQVCRVEVWLFAMRGGGKRKHRVQDPKGGEGSKPPSGASTFCTLPYLSATLPRTRVPPPVSDDCHTLNAGTVLDRSHLLTFLRLSSKIKIAPGLFHIGFGSFPLGCLGAGVWPVTHCRARRLYGTRQQQLQGEQGTAENVSSMTNLGWVPAIRGSSLPMYWTWESKVHKHSYQKWPLIGGKGSGGAVHLKSHCSRSYKDEIEAFSLPGAQSCTRSTPH